MKRLFARLTRQGTPALETCLCEEHDDQKNRNRLRGRMDSKCASRLADGDKHGGRVYVEVTHDAECACQVCGARGPRAQGGRFLCGALATMPTLPERWSELPSFAEALGRWNEETHERMVGDVTRLEAALDMAEAVIEAAKDVPEVWSHGTVGGKLQALAIFLMRT